MSFPTWSDLNDDSLVPPLGARIAPDIGPDAVMVCTEPDVRYVKSNFAKKSAPVPFFLGRLFTLENGITVAGPYLGAPCAAMVLESLIAKGVSRVVVVGWCGGMADHLKVGDIVIPDGAISDEGTSRNYMVMPKNNDFPTLFPHSTLSTSLKSSFDDNGVTYHAGTIWTTDAIYRETPKKVEFFRNRGAIAVEMECSALFSVAAYRNIDLAATLIVSDTLAKGEWEPGFRRKQFKNARRKVLDIVCQREISGR